WSKGEYQADTVNLLVSNVRVREEPLRDFRAEAEAPKVADEELMRLLDKHGTDTVLIAFHESQEYDERLARARLKELPNGTWETVDYLDMDPELGDGLIPIKVKMTIDDDQIYYDLEGTHSTVSCFLNASYGASL